MRFILGIETGCRAGSVALAKDGEAAEGRPLAAGRHSGGLTAEIAALLRAHGLAPSDVAGVAVCEGPGSFTGLRVGLAWAKGFALGMARPLALVSTHEAAAHAFRRAAGRLLTLLPGERGHFQLMGWRGGERAARQSGPEEIAEGELGAAIAAILAADAGGSGGTGLDGPASGTLLLAPDLPAAWRSAVPPRIGVIDPSLPGEPGPGGGGLLAAAAAELGDRALLESAPSDWIAAAPAYGRAPNARKPAS